MNSIGDAAATIGCCAVAPSTAVAGNVVDGVVVDGVALGTATEVVDVAGTVVSGAVAGTVVVEVVLGLP